MSVPSLRRDRVLRLIVIGGIALRALYAASTPWTVRAHDTAGHIEYIEYVAQHLALPPPQAGWEFYQPPLYYLIAGTIDRAGAQFGASREAVLHVVQALSTLFACLTFLVGVQLCLEFAPAENRLAARTACLLLATLPGLIFPASRINNDLLVELLIAASVLLMVRGARSRTRLLSLTAGGVVGLGLLTKSNAALVAPLLLVIPVLLARENMREALVRGVLAGVVAIVCAGWLPIARQMPAKDVVAGNRNYLNRKLTLETSVRHLVVVSPAEMVDMPFNSAWSDDRRRQYFWEYLYRSAFFGEFDHGDARRTLARVVLGASFLLWPLLLLGLFPIGARDGRHVLVLVLWVGALVCGQLIFRLVAPFSTSQDFRYITSAAIPMAVLVGRGVARLPRPLTPLGVVITAAAACAAAAFVATLLFS